MMSVVNTNSSNSSESSSVTEFTPVDDVPVSTMYELLKLFLECVSRFVETTNDTDVVFVCSFSVLHIHSLSYHFFYSNDILSLLWISLYSCIHAYSIFSLQRYCLVSLLFSLIENL